MCLGVCGKMKNGLYSAPLRDMQFALYDVLDIETVLGQCTFEVSIDRETLDQVIEGAARFCSGVLAPLNASGDQEGCALIDGEVVTPSGFKEAYEQYMHDGWSGLCCDVEHNGQGLSSVASAVLGEMLGGSNIAWALYPRLSEGVYRCLRANASASIKELYLPALVSGAWSGTMCLTEPHCGTDLGLLRTQAVPFGDAYRITGTKMFISSGEHDLTSNILHMVLARLPGAPSGTRGISLFLVPKFLPKDGGLSGVRNGVYCDSIENKLGLHGNATCVLRFEEAQGYLIGEPHKGLAAMFVMMNSARLGTGAQALGLTEQALQKSIAYARERIQSRAPGRERNSTAAADPIILQPDVRRMLLTQKSWAEAARMFLYWVALQIDIEAYAPDQALRDEARDFLALLTPVVKAFVSDNAVESASLAVQIHGGSGYIVDSGIEQTFRDVRILPIYEGTNGVQSYDLLARKVLGDDGVRLQRFTAFVRKFLLENRGEQAMIPFSQPLSDLVDEIEKLVPELASAVRNDECQLGASATDFLRLIGHMVFAYFWARAAQAALTRLDAEDPFRREKLATARFYFERLLPETETLLRRVRVSADSMVDPYALPV